MIIHSSNILYRFLLWLSKSSFSFLIPNPWDLKNPEAIVDEAISTLCSFVHLVVSRFILFVLICLLPFCWIWSFITESTGSYLEFYSKLTFSMALILFMFLNIALFFGYIRGWIASKLKERAKEDKGNTIWFIFKTYFLDKHQKFCRTVKVEHDK